MPPDGLDLSLVADPVPLAEIGPVGTDIVSDNVGIDRLRCGTTRWFQDPC